MKDLVSCNKSEVQIVLISEFRTMHPLVEYSSILLGLALGYTRGGYWGSALLISSLIAALHLYMQGGRWEVLNNR